MNAEAMFKMMRLSAAEIRLVLDALSAKYGPGYADGDVGKLQAKLSLMLQVRTAAGDE